MRILRAIVSFIFILTSALFLYFYIGEVKSTDKTFPVITIEDDFIDVKKSADNKELLRGVTAFDGKDGDITDKIIVESVSKFIQKGVSVVTYSVCDSDNHVATSTRKINFKDYKSPRFYMKDSLILSSSENVMISDYIGAKDSLDGDISDNLIVTAEDFDDTSDGTYKISVQASNSKGDTIYLNLPVVVKKDWIEEVDINLKSYLIYVKKGRNINFMKYVKSTTDKSSGEPVDAYVSVKTNYKKDRPGVYSVNYIVKNYNGIVIGQSILMVVVEG